MTMKGLIQLVSGLIVWILMLYAFTYASWWTSLIQLLKGGLLFILFFVGLGLLVLAMSELRR